MRVIAGIAGRRRLKVPSGGAVRPTAGRVKEALFNILADRVPGSLFLDLFAGSGGIGIEALSRGALKVVFIEKNFHHMRLLNNNLRNIGFTEKAVLINRDVLKSLPFLQDDCFDLVFMDPPYDRGFENSTLSAVARYNLVRPDGMVVVESSKYTVLPPEVACLGLVRQERYGDTLLSFYENKK